MWRSQLREEESRLEAGRRIKYKETAFIKLKWLHFQTDEPEELDGKNVGRLKSIFRKDCRRLDPHNYIAAVIEQQALNIALQLSGISAQQLSGYPPDGYPELVFPAGYQAAKELDLE